MARSDGDNLRSEYINRPAAKMKGASWGEHRGMSVARVRYFEFEYAMDDIRRRDLRYILK